MVGEEHSSKREQHEQNGVPLLGIEDVGRAEAKRESISPDTGMITS